MQQTGGLEAGQRTINVFLTPFCGRGTIGVGLTEVPPHGLGARSEELGRVGRGNPRPHTWAGGVRPCFPAGGRRLPPSSRTLIAGTSMAGWAVYAAGGRLDRGWPPGLVLTIDRC